MIIYFGTPPPRKDPTLLEQMMELNVLNILFSYHWILVEGGTDINLQYYSERLK